MLFKKLDHSGWLMAEFLGFLGFMVLDMMRAILYYVVQKRQAYVQFY